MAGFKLRRFVTLAVLLTIVLYLLNTFRHSRADDFAIAEHVDPAKQGSSGRGKGEQAAPVNQQEQQPAVPSRQDLVGFTPPQPGTPLLGIEELPAALWFPSTAVDASLRVPAYNVFPAERPRPRTPLFVGFSRTQALVEQTVVSYIAAGWPREDIIVVDNSGTMDANPEGLLSAENPFALNYTLYRTVYGVSILQTPTLLTFSQLMNFYLRTSIAQRWAFYFWTHQDVAVLSDELIAPESYRSFYQRAVDTLAELGYHNDADFFASWTAPRGTWALKFFHYDWLTLMNVAAWRQIGQWDTFIPFYPSDCDAYSRLSMHGFTKQDAPAGHIFDLADAIPDPASRFFAQDPDEELTSMRFARLKVELESMMKRKWKNKELSRNTWQASVLGGKGEPWTYDPRGFQAMWVRLVEHSRAQYKRKWGTSDCRLEERGKKLGTLFKGV